VSGGAGLEPILRFAYDVRRQAWHNGAKEERAVMDELLDELHRITTRPDVCGGRPCIRGLRVRVSDILDMLAAGAGRAEILADYPYLEDADISAALAYAARLADHAVIRAAE
jgi:uncharacterized protein (DUF433 family)